MERTALFNEVVSYVAHAQLWHRLRAHTPQQDLNELFVSMLETESRVMRHYGLPETFEFTTPL